MKDDLKKVKGLAENGVGDTVKNEINEFKENTKSITGNAKNALKVSNVTPEPVSKIIIFSIVFLVPILSYLAMAVVIVILSAGLVTAIIVNDPDIGYNDIKDKSESSDKTNNRDSSVPESVRGKFLVPWNAESVSSPQGYRQKPGKNASVDHWGVDLQPTPKISSEQSLALFPIYPGVVYRVSNTANGRPLGGGYGNAIVIKHTVDGVDFYSLYAHLRYIKVKEGETVGFKTHMGRMGCTGSSYGSFEGCGTHLHLEIYNSNYGVSGRKLENLLKVSSYLTCGEGKTMADRAGNHSHCVKYRSEKVGSVPKIE